LDFKKHKELRQAAALSGFYVSLSRSDQRHQAGFETAASNTWKLWHLWTHGHNLGRDASRQCKAHFAGELVVDERLANDLRLADAG